MLDIPWMLIRMGAKVSGPDRLTKDLLDKINRLMWPHGIVARYDTRGTERICIERMGVLTAILKRDRPQGANWQLLDARQLPVKGFEPVRHRSLETAVLRYLGL